MDNENPKDPSSDSAFTRKQDPEIFYPQSSYPGPISRDEARERRIWEEQVQPVVEKCGLDFEFQFIKRREPFTEVNVLKVTQWMVTVCNGLPSNPGFKNVADIMRALRQGRGKVIPK
jgi:hypothetical protein